MDKHVLTRSHWKMETRPGDDKASLRRRLAPGALVPKNDRLRMFMILLGQPEVLEESGQT